MAKKPQKKQSSLLFNFYIVLGALQAIIILFWAWALIWLSQQQGDTAPGAGLVLALVYPLFLATTCVLAVVDLTGLMIYLLRHKPAGKRRILAFVVIAISLIPIGFGLFLTYHRTVIAPAERQMYEQERREQERKASDEERELERLIELNRQSVGN